MTREEIQVMAQYQDELQELATRAVNVAAAGAKNLKLLVNRCAEAEAKLEADAAAKKAVAETADAVKKAKK